MPRSCCNNAMPFSLLVAWAAAQMPGRLLSLRHHPYQIVRHGCRVHAVPGAWLGHPCSMNRVAGAGRPVTAVRRERTSTTGHSQAGPTPLTARAPPGAATRRWHGDPRPVPLAPWARTDSRILSSIRAVRCGAGHYPTSVPTRAYYCSTRPPSGLRIHLTPAASRNLRMVPLTSMLVPRHRVVVAAFWRTSDARTKRPVPRIEKPACDLGRGGRI
jgi:hypothetical protein